MRSGLNPDCSFVSGLQGALDQFVDAVEAVAVGGDLINSAKFLKLVSSVGTAYASGLACHLDRLDSALKKSKSFLMKSTLTKLGAILRSRK